MATSFVDTTMESVAVRRLDALLTRVADQDTAPGLLDARASSFEAIYSAHHRDVSRHVILVTRGRDDVEEIVAETFARAFAAWRSGHGPAGRPLPWLLVIARRIATDRWRRQRIIAWLPLPDSRRTHHDAWEGRQATKGEPGGPDADARAAEFWLWLDALSQALPSRQRDVIFLRYQHDLSDEDIGEVLGLSASGVRTLVSRALSGSATTRSCGHEPSRPRPDPDPAWNAGWPPSNCSFRRPRHGGRWATRTCDPRRSGSWPDRRSGEGRAVVVAWGSSWRLGQSSR